MKNLIKFPRSAGMLEQRRCRFTLVCFLSVCFCSVVLKPFYNCLFFIVYLFVPNWTLVAITSSVESADQRDSFYFKLNFKSKQSLWGSLEIFFARQLDPVRRKQSNLHQLTSLAMHSIKKLIHNPLIKQTNRDKLAVRIVAICCCHKMVRPVRIVAIRCGHKMVRPVKIVAICSTCSHNILCQVIIVSICCGHIILGAAQFRPGSLLP